MKTITTLLLTLVSTAAMALPASTDSLIKGLVSGGQLSALLETEKNIGEVKITRVADFRRDSSIESLCGDDVMSRSASVLEVEVIYARNSGTTAAVYSSTNYFVTTESPKNLKPCNGTN